MLRQGTGEHGVGVGKKQYLVEELGMPAIRLMKTVKKAIDPLGLMNPGKVSHPSIDSYRLVLRLGSP